jgi:spoIIIJ-associated protein
MRVEGVEAEGRTVNEATEKALADLGLTRNDVEVEVLSEGRPRLLGFRGEPARVRVTPIERVAPPPPSRLAAASDDEAEDEEYDEDEDEDYEDDEEYDEDEDEEYEDEDEDEDEEAEPELPPELQRTIVELDAEQAGIAAGVLEDLLRLMNVEATVTPRAPETAGDGVGMIEAVLDVDGDDLGILIGRRGATLASLQYVLNLIVSKKMERRVSFGIDVDGYRRRREEALVTLARRMASRVRGTGRSVTLEPMPPNERRIVHLALANDPAVMTVSIGEGEDRKVAITPSR